MKKYISILLVGILFVSSLTGCDPKKSDGKTETSKKQVTTTTTKKVTDNEKVDESNTTSVKKIIDTTSTTNNREETTTVKIPSTPTTKNKNTTAYRGSSNLKRQQVTLDYLDGDQQKSMTVTVITGFEQEMLSYINDVRANANKNPLKENDELRNAAIIRAAEASVRWSHTRPDGSSCFTILDVTSIRPRIRSAGENLGKNQTSVKQVMDSWMGSKGHRENILSTNNDYNYVGLAWVIAPNGDNMWAQMFAYLS